MEIDEVDFTILARDYPVAVGFRKLVDVHRDEILASSRMILGWNPRFWRASKHAFGFQKAERANWRRSARLFSAKGW